MYKKHKIQMLSTTIKINESYKSERIESKVKRILNNKEPISDGAPLIYTERKDGVQAQYDIRTDRFDEALDAMDKVQKSHIAKREQRLNEGKEKFIKKVDENTKNADGGSQ